LRYFAGRMWAERETAMKFKVFHYPDGGDQFELARFARKGDATLWAKELTDRPANDIRLVEVVEQRGKRQVLVCRFGWAVEDLVAAELM